ncbi:MAG: hypothetical protein QNJ60_00865 [Xenococcaceae cyanobacterium MO_188.B19]|nr:hypothetical protein [Xenococcaceae cyanobacterium MO_188.B19]
MTTDLLLLDFVRTIVKHYDFDRINQIKLDKDKTKNIVNGTIILQFNPDYDYVVDEFRDFEHGEQNFKIIQDFFKKHKVR